MLAWFQRHQMLIYILGALSVGMLLILPVAIAAILVLLPPDYFAESHRPRHARRKRPLTILRCIIFILKNLLGAILLLAGIAMLVLPGQGVLTITLGISLMNFPGKFRAERWLITRGPTLRITNKLRLRFHRAPLILSHPSDASTHQTQRSTR
jgi:hypothetical protein